ncbi:LytR/AlgR family response regulator transcription factor [Streptococcus danieliae]
MKGKCLRGVMNIFVYEELCRDHFWWEDLLQHVLVTIGVELEQLEIRTTSAGLLDAWSRRGRHQVFILVLHGESSCRTFFDLVVQIRKRDALASIIIVADSLLFMEEVFRSQVGVLDYILRDLPPIRFHQRLATVLLQIHSYFIQDTPKELILIRNSQVQIQIPVRKVFYIERSFRAHYISIVTSDEEVSVIANLQDVKATSPFLFSCHRSFLVNPFNIRRVDRQLRLALFPKGYSCPISRNRMMELLNLIHFQCQACSRDDKRT